jgi:PAS domain S-box-containing protein
MRSEERFRLFVEAVKDYAIYTLDPDGRVTSWNQGAERIKGYSALEVIGQHFSLFFTEEDKRARKPEQELQVAADQGRFETEGWRVRKGGSQFWANVVLTAIKDGSGNLIGFVKVTRDFTERMRADEALRQTNSALSAEVRERKLAEQKLAASERSLRELSMHLLRSQDEERRRIGRELHDSLGQYLAVLKMNLDSLQSAIQSSANGFSGVLADCVRLADDSIKEMRTISYLLYPPMLEEVGLKSAIPWYLDGFSKRSNIEITFDVNSDFGRLAADVELALFRVLQESLTNVHRHSESSAASVRLSTEQGYVVLEIKDEGKGMPAALVQDSENGWARSLGVGLRGMQERMRQFSGKLEVYSSDKGTTVKASIPVTQSVLAASKLG